MIAAFYNWLDRRRELQAKLDWRMGFLVAVSDREFPELTPIYPAADIINGSPAFVKGYEYGTDCSLAIGSPDDKVTPRSE